MSRNQTEAQADVATQIASGMVKMIEPVFAGVPPEIAGAVLGQLLAKLVAGHHPIMRDEAMRLVIDMARDLVPIEVEEMIERGQCGPEWREATRQ
ncbi:hypothetical protein JQ604_15200 [Bradyrhizobium jicamae]|uniref:hypothetical protein n=1 Tax=Bradyrhizobium jicamae TaxID=280332 RepID=UPI001BA709D0|nr:hypothetical protein [Bradyrhizobium jicamae]MBR0753534.1 hypothetical protein [Bradyrhizobium jicamae]